MGKLIAAAKQWRVGKVLAVFLTGMILLVTTACSNPNELGARPHNPPVQMGGQNNPHKAGGDNYSQYKMHTDPSVRSNRNHASLTGSSMQLVATAPINNGSNQILYPGSSGTPSADSVNDFVSPEQQRRLTDPSQIPAPRQPVIDRSDPDAHLLEKTGQAFRDASQFVLDGIDSTQDRLDYKDNPVLDTPSIDRPNERVKPYR